VADLPLTPEDVADIVSILDGSNYQTLDIKTGRFRLRVARDGTGWTQEWDFSESQQDSEQLSPRVATGEGLSPAGEEGDICAPLPGTFYRAPQPGAPPFVELGSEVGPDTVIGIIETMKLMNPVHAGASGKIAAILADNGEMVSKNAALMRLG
jgi:acetyl-CoA carboxylase biotin carboxyl carrier protein